MDDSPVILSSDHAGWGLKEAIKEYLKKKGIAVEDVSEPQLDSQDDYPKYAFRVAKQVAAGKFGRGITICGTGIGASIAANRVRGVRAALCLTPEMGSLAKSHNNANVLVLGARLTAADTAFSIIDAWMSAEFKGGRHERRVQQLDIPE